mgnify:CR=1 FL=1
MHHSHYVHSNALIRKKMIIAKNNQQRNNQAPNNNIENMILGTIETSNNTIDQNLYARFKNRRDYDTLQFKDKSKYLQNIPYKTISDKSAFEKKINTEDDLVLNRVAKSSADTRVIEKRIAKTINERKQFDLEQRQEYTIDKKKKYEKEFADELNGRFNNICINQSDTKDLKKGSYKYHEKCQQELEKNQRNIDQIIDQLIDGSYINKML